MKNPAMTLFSFPILVFCSEVAYTLVPDADQVAKKLKVSQSHLGCGALTENTFYALNQVRQCHITPEEMEISQTKIIFYTKHFRKELMQQNVEYNIDLRSGTVGITTTAASITPELELLLS